MENFTKSYPSEEKFSLVSQMRRAGISVVANIVEGSKRKSIKDRAHFHNMADTSLEELTNKSREVGRMLDALTKAL